MGGGSPAGLQVTGFRVLVEWRGRCPWLGNVVALAREHKAPTECWDALLEAAGEMDMSSDDPTHGPTAAIVFAQQRK